MIRTGVRVGLVVGMVLASAVAHAQVTYFGEVCWQVQSVTPGDPETFQWRLGVLSYGAGHFAMNGRAVRATSGYVRPMHGNAEVVDGSVVMTLVSSEAESVSGTRESSTFNVVLDVATLGGRYRQIGVEAPGGGMAESVTDEGTLSRVSCP